MFTIIVLSAFWTMLCSWVFWLALTAVGAFILGWLFRSPKIDEWRHKYENEVSSNTGFAKKYGKLEKSNLSFMKEKSNFEKLIDKQKGEIATLRNKSSKLENDFRSISTERDGLNQRLGLLNSEITSLKGTGEVVVESDDENEKEVARLTDILHNRDSEIEKLRNVVSETKAEKDEYIRRSESYKPRFEEANLERNTLKVKYDKLVAATANLSSSDIDHAAENKNLKDEVAKLKAQVAAAPEVNPNADAELEAARKAASKAEAERSDLQIKYESLLRHHEQLEASNKSSVTPIPVPVAKVTPTPTPPPAPVAEDDLTKIEGIGPKISELIKAGGIKTFADLAKTDPSVIKGLLNEAGPRYKMHDPASWPLQAGMAARGEWDALEKWQDEHDGGKLKNPVDAVAETVTETPAAPVAGFVSQTPVAPVNPIAAVDPTAEDDLTKIEGIGPKIGEIIKAGGIKTWVALSNTDPSVIKGLLDEAGPRFKMHDPASWPLQAGMAARGEWEALEKWQDEHDGGKLS